MFSYCKIGCPHISSPGLIHIARGCTKLVELDLSGKEDKKKKRKDEEARRRSKSKWKKQTQDETKKNQPTSVFLLPYVL